MVVGVAAAAAAAALLGAAEARQQRAVNVYRLVHEHTVEEKVLERANLKLQLGELAVDNLLLLLQQQQQQQQQAVIGNTAVIQQGRLHEAKQRQPDLTAKTLLSMVQFGAEHIFKPAGKNDLTEEELDAILARGQERTEQMQAMLQQQVRRSLLDFSSSSSSSSSSLYEADDLCYPEERKAADREAWLSLAQEQLAASTERDSRRRLRGNYKDAAAAEQQQQQQQQNNKDTRKPMHIPRVPKLPNMQDWQFYRRERIEELQAIDVQWRLSQGSSRPLTEEEKEERKKLIAEGFRGWARRDLLAFVRGCEMYGRWDLERIATEVEGKSAAEVRKYSQVFWSRLEEIGDWKKLLKKIQDGEAVIQRRRELEQVIVRRQQQSDFPWRRLPINFAAASKSKSFFTEEEDIFVLNLTTLLGYGNWEKLRSQGERFSRGRRRLDMPATKQQSPAAATAAAAAAANASPAAADGPSGSSGEGPAMISVSSEAQAATPAAATAAATAATTAAATETSAAEAQQQDIITDYNDMADAKRRRLLASAD
ncbi:SWI/SNF-related matrix-associated actin-dependent regulator of chromatin, putative [Eimeria brunetti]|uniref:SWI/SNF-related matrix-associated actin-dependent regulator of chromatin, putative n=1 Tax=Eimeria brunetti TaxID=51314 RepID=U6LS78_9EIME|nr:SWI/SNF-related matrix-associated actin-dependent regulator of chromatin, putative [Eimeria brunetti]